MALPKVLEAMLQTTLNTTSLKSWNIYQDQNGDINLKLKFSASEESVNRVQQTTYTRKSTKQVQRDLERSRQWRKNSNQPPIQNDQEPEQSVTQQHPKHSATLENSAIGMRTRAMSKNDPELARTQEEHPETSLNPFAESFIMPSVTPEDSSTDTELELSPSITLNRDADSSPCDYARKPANDEASPTVAAASLEADKVSKSIEKPVISGSIRRRKDHAMCNFCGRPQDPSCKQCVKCKMLVCTTCVFKGCHQSHTDLYGLVNA